LAIRQNNTDYLQRFNRFFAACEMIDLNRAVFEHATTLRANNHYTSFLNNFYLLTSVSYKITWNRNALILKTI
jgi:hypothetical protein